MNIFNNTKFLKRVSNIFLILLILLTSVFLFQPLARIGLKTQITYNEGWNAYYAKAVSAGQKLYQDSWAPLNYPPVSFYFISVISNLFGDPFFVGRFISLISLLGISFFIAWVVKILTNNLYSALFSAFFYLGMFEIIAPRYIGMNDPQMLGHLFMITALVLYILRAQRRYLLVSILCTLGLFIKQNLIALPLALVIDNFFRSHKFFNKLFIYLAVSLIVIFSVIYFLEGGFVEGFFLGREYLSIWSLINKIAGTFSYYLLIPLVLSLVWSVYSLKQTKYRILALYLMIALLTGVVFYGGEGTTVNMFFDLLISIAIILGVFLSQIEYKKSIVLGISLILGLSLELGGIKGAWPNFSNLQVREVATLEDITLLSKYSGPVLCERLSLCYFANKPFIYDPFLVGEMIVVGKKDEKEVLTLIENSYFDVIQLNFVLDESYFTPLEYTTLKGRGRFTENILRAIGKNYHLIRKSANGAFYASKLAP